MRFRCAANRNNDHVFIDDVYITGVLSLNNSPVGDKIIVSENIDSDKIIEQNSQNVLSDMRLFPNPTSGNLNIQFSATEATDIQMIISDFSGQILKNQTWEADSGRQKITEHTDDLPQGYYFLQLVTPNGKLSEKFVVIR